MTALRPLGAPTGLRHGDHVCWTYTDDAEFSSTVTAFLDEGRQRGEQLLVIGAARARLLEMLHGLPDRDAMLTSGPLEVCPTGEIYRVGAELDLATQVDVFRRAVESALVRGRTGLRVAADVTPLARDAAEHRGRLHAFERLADDLIGSAPLTGMCLYDATLANAVLGPLLLLHPLQHHGSQTPLGHLSGRGAHLELSGEADCSTADDVFTALVDLAGTPPGEIVLDLSELEFLDIAGARALARAGTSLAGTGVQLRLVGARGTVARCLELFGLLTEGTATA